MAFKSVEQYNNERYHDMFRLVDDQDSAEVIFLYRSKNDELKVDCHYIRSNAYTGYVHCCGKDCPACARNFRVDTKIFVPMYVLKHTDRMNGTTIINQIEFWDRKMGFDKQLNQAVFYNYPNPSEYVFKITRNGVASDRNTRFDIKAIGRNNFLSYEDILAKFNAQMPDYYSTVIREYSAIELGEILRNSSESGNSDLPEYTPIPRDGYKPSIPDTYVNTSDALGDSAESPAVDDFSDTDGDGDLVTPEF